MSHDVGKETAAYAAIANALADWIDNAQLRPDQLHDVYAAHVLLCELIRRLPETNAEVGRLIQERDGYGQAAMAIAVDLVTRATERNKAESECVRLAMLLTKVEADLAMRTEERGILEEAVRRSILVAGAAYRQRDALQQKWLKPTCSGCGGPHPFDTTVPSVVWNRVIRANGLPDYLCATCILYEFVRRRESFTADLCGDAIDGFIPIEVRVASKEALDSQALSEQNTALRCELRALQQAFGEVPTCIGTSGLKAKAAGETDRTKP